MISSSNLFIIYIRTYVSYILYSVSEFNEKSLRLNKAGLEFYKTYETRIYK